MVVEFRRATGADLPAMMEIYHGAQAYLRQQGLDQWQNGYPQETLVSRDIEAGNAFVLTADGVVAVVAALFFGDEADYTTIYEGAWGTDGPYAAIHRLALGARYRGSGLAGQMMRELEALCQKAAFGVIRVDTHPGNRPMQKLLESCGFTYRGIIYLAQASGGSAGDKRLAYDKLVAAIENSELYKEGKL